MRSSKKVIKIQLPEDKNEEQIIFGLVSADPDYKISLLINRKLGISLKTANPVEITDEKGNIISFSRFSDMSGAPDQVFSLVSNKSGNNYLLRKLKNVDFLFQYSDFYRSYDPLRITEILKELDSITGVFRLDTEQLKEKNIRYL